MGYHWCVWCPLPKPPGRPRQAIKCIECFLLSLPLVLKVFLVLIGMTEVLPMQWIHGFQEAGKASLDVLVHFADALRFSKNYSPSSREAALLDILRSLPMRDVSPLFFNPEGLNTFLR